MTPGERFKNWIEGLSESWKDRLRGWMMSWLERGLLSFLEAREPELIDLTRETIEKIKQQPDIPVELRNILEKATKTGQIGDVIAGYLYTILGSVFAIMSLGAPIGRIWEHAQERAVKSYRLDPIAVITAWRRDPEKYVGLFEDLKEQGWDEPRIEALKFFTLFMPVATDIVSWYAREVYEPEMIDRYGLTSELPNYEKTDFPKIGVDSTQARNYWMAHWEHASYMQIREMLHRGVLSLGKEMPTPPTTKEGWATRDAEGIKAAYDWYRLVEIPPFWRARLTEMMFEVPTRVDVRRWWDMRTISEQELYNIYHRQGYHGTDLDNYVLWTKVYVAFPDLMARMIKGWISPEDVSKELEKLGMPPDRIQEMMEAKIGPEEAAVVEEERQLTVTDIIMWLKKYPDKREEAIELIMDLGYSRAAAEFKIVARIAAEAGSPETFAEFKELTTKYRIAAGREAKPMTEEIKKAAAEVVRLTREVKALELSIEDEKRGLIEEEVLPEETTARLTELQVSLHRAESALALAKSEYDRQVAEWKHGE